MEVSYVKILQQHQTAFSVFQSNFSLSNNGVPLISSLSHFLTYLNHQDLKTGEEFNRKLLKEFNRHVMAASGIGPERPRYPLRVWVSPGRTCPFVVSVNGKFLELWRVQFQVKQLYFPSNKLHVKLASSSDAILLLPHEFPCACKPRTEQTAQCSLHLCCPRACWVLCSHCSFHRLGYPTGQDGDRHHFCLPGVETSPATFLSPRAAFRK